MPLLLIRADQNTGGPAIAFRSVSVEATSESWHETSGPVQLVDPKDPVFERARLVALRQIEEDVSTVGRELWNLVFEGDGALGAWWKAESEGAAGNARTVLDIGVEALRAVPWELLAPPVGPPVFRRTDAPWVRAYKTPWDFPEPLRLPTKLLVIVGAADSDGIAVDPELEAIFRALRDSQRRWNIEILDQPSGPRDIRARYGDVKPDIVHFIGHGMQIDDEQGLLMEGPGSNWLLTPALIGEWPLPPPRLVVLNACRSAVKEERDAAWSCVDAFVQRGAAAVIAMQGDIDAASAVNFSQTLYDQLNQGQSIDAAVCEARYAVHEGQVVGQTDKASWLFPALTVTADPDLVLPIKLDADPLAVAPYAEAARKVAACVDRAVERRILWTAIDPTFDEKAGSLCLVTGEERIGKSTLVVSSLLTLRLRDRNVVYVDMDRHHRDLRRKASWLKVLRAVRDAIWEEGWLPEAAVEHRNRFNHELSFLLKQKAPPPWTDKSQRTDSGEEYFPAGEHAQDWIDSIFDSFFAMLDRASGRDGLLVVLDSLRVVEESDLREQLSPRLIEPAADDRKWPRLRFVVVGRPEEIQNLGERTMALAKVTLTILPFKRAELDRLTRETFALSDLDPPMKDAFELLKGIENDFSPGDLESIAHVIRLGLGYQGVGS